MSELLSVLRTLFSRSTSARQLTELAAQLTRDTDQAGIGTLMEAIPFITRTANDTSLTLKARVNALLAIDEALAPVVTRLDDECRYGQSALRASLPALLSYCTEMSGAYQSCVRHYLTHPTSLVHERLKLATVCGMHHQVRAMLYKALRYLQPEASDWRTAGRFILFAEEHDYARQPFALPGNAQPVQLEALFGRAILLFLSQPENLLHRDIVATDTLLAFLCSHVELSRRPAGAEPVYSIDLESGTPPERLMRGHASRSRRYSSLEPASTALADLVLDLDSRDKPLPDVLDNSLTREQWRALSRSLSLRWSPDGGKSLRRSDRAQQNEEVTVADGLSAIARALQFGDNQTRRAASPAGWRLVDESESGLGLYYPGMLPDLTPGRLILVRMHDGSCHLGVIRRLMRQSQGIRVGIERLGSEPVPVTLQQNADADVSMALYVPRNKAHGRDRWLLVPQRLSPASGNYLLHAMGKSYRICLEGESQIFDDAMHLDFSTLSRVE